MKITREGFAVVEGDMLLSRYVEEQGRLDVDYPTTDLMLPYIPEGGIVVDVGACIGDHTVAYSQMVGPQGKVYAFEPNPIAFECLLYNTKGYSNVVACGFGLSNFNGNVNVKVDAYNVGATRLVDYTDAGLHSTVLRLDDIAKDWTRLDFMKIDAEGHEPWILDGAKETLRRLHPVMLIEIQTEMLAHNGFTPKDVYDRLANLGFGFSEGDRHSYDLLVL
jgi:FkbM family methyltransferase